MADPAPVSDLEMLEQTVLRHLVGIAKALEQYRKTTGAPEPSFATRARQITDRFNATQSGSSGGR